MHLAHSSQPCLPPLRASPLRLRSPSPRTLHLVLADADVDLLRFDAAVAAGDEPSLVKVVSLYRGPLLEGWMEEWVFQERQSREQAYLCALETLAQAARQQGDLPAAEPYLRQAVAADPIRINLLSDTQTRPTAAMREAMARAEVGDEQIGDDPTVNLLCERVADLLGKEAAVFMPSGTMCNVAATLSHCRPGDELLAHATAHIIAADASDPVEVHADAWLSLNGRRRQRWIDPEVDLASVPRTAPAATYVLP